MPKGRPSVVAISISAPRSIGPISTSSHAVSPEWSGCASVSVTARPVAALPDCKRATTTKAAIGVHMLYKIRTTAPLRAGAFSC